MQPPEGPGHGRRVGSSRSRSATALLQSAHDYYVPLSVAAAIAFHQAHDSSKPCQPGRLRCALNLAGAALSRLVTIYVLRDARQGRVPLTIDFTSSRFKHAAPPNYTWQQRA
ncbi:MAG TPA: hypothetical protein VFB75_18015 [Burkholderiales bacterium]|nr:hypothetical protein [Burkholderiales bacterium]